VVVVTHLKHSVVIKSQCLERRVVLEDGDERDILLSFDYIDSIPAFYGKTLKLYAFSCSMVAISIRKTKIHFSIAGYKNASAKDLRALLCWCGKRKVPCPTNRSYRLSGGQG
jgi:hypothetical protein